jgi:hypothetical protein
VGGGDVRRQRKRERSGLLNVTEASWGGGLGLPPVDCKRQWTRTILPIRSIYTRSKAFTGGISLLVWFGLWLPVL